MRLYFIGGASGSGKTAVMPHLKELLKDGIAVYDFDDSGVPEGADKNDVKNPPRNGCINYMPFESEKNLADALEITHILWFVYRVLAQDRLMQACGREQLMSFQHGKLSEMLKELIALCKITDRP